MSEQVEAVLEELHRRLEALYGDRLVKMVLFGSQARGDAEAGSDIDVLVVLRGPVSPCEEIERSLDHVAGLSLEHDVVISCVFVSDTEYQRERSPLLLNVRREGVTL